MPSNRHVARAIASAFLAGPMDVDDLVDRAAGVLGKRWRWLRPVAQRFHESFSSSTPPRMTIATRFILADQGFERAWRKHEDIAVNGNWLLASSSNSSEPARYPWPIPNIKTPGELAEWLKITPRDLDWFADARLQERKTTKPERRRYRYRLLSKGTKRFRVIESPILRLKRVQRQILRDILDKVPPHESVHGFRRGRSIRTFAEAHVGCDVLLKLDLRDFFPSIYVSRVKAMFRTLGYPELVADSLAGLCTNCLPYIVWDETPNNIGWTVDERTRRLYQWQHLPQGAPTSPSIANLCAYRLDCRLAGLARSVGAAYTRYADDIAFSGGDTFARRAKRFSNHVAAIVMDEGFLVQFHKTRIMASSQCQQLAGIVVNQHVNISRKKYDELKATLYNCVKHGAESQNYERRQNFCAHLTGRVSFVESLHPERGRKLRALLKQINW